MANFNTWKIVRHRNHLLALLIGATLLAGPFAATSLAAPRDATVYQCGAAGFFTRDGKSVMPGQGKAKDPNNGKGQGIGRNQKVTHLSVARVTSSIAVTVPNWDPANYPQCHAVGWPNPKAAVK